jgi:hypothetical protein
MKTKTPTMLTAFALLMSLGLALPAAAQQQPGQQPDTKKEMQHDQMDKAKDEKAKSGKDMSADATVATVDSTNLMLATEEGDEFSLAEGNLVKGLAPGTKVRITYQEIDGEKKVTHIERVK